MMPKRLERLAAISQEATQGAVTIICARDADKLAEMMNAEEDDPRMVEALIVGRNRNWAQWIKQRMERPGTVMLAVGAGHLVGSDGVPTAVSGERRMYIRIYNGDAEVTNDEDVVVITTWES